MHGENDRRRFASGDVSPRPHGLLRRGVWQAPFLGRDGEMILAAVDRNGRLVGDVHVVPHGASRIDAADRLLAALDLADPVPDIRII